MQKKTLLLGLILYFSGFHFSSAQSLKTLTLDTCYALARMNYPLVKQLDLIEKSAGYSIENASKGTWPQLNVVGISSYQSDVTTLPIKLPNIDVPVPGKDQYKLYGEISQPITDLFVIKDQKNLIEVSAEVEKQKVEVELYKLKERVNQLYFGILLIDAQLKLTELLKKDIQTGMDKTKAAIANGVAIKSSLDILKVEMLKANQKTIELKATRNGYAEMLQLFTSQAIYQSTILETPERHTLYTPVTKRPELTLFDCQVRSEMIKGKMLTYKNYPRISLFLQGGVGKPALNMLSNDFKGYYLGGLRMNWNFSGFYTKKNDWLLHMRSRETIEVQREAFLFNTNIILKQQEAEMSKYDDLIASDKEIIQLRESITTTAKNQLENGTVTMNDYLLYVNAENQAKQNLKLHEIQSLMAWYNYQTTGGN